MIGVVITVLGAYTSYRLWGDHIGLAIFAIAATLYQASSLNEMFKEESGLLPKDRWQAIINMISTIVIVGLFIFSLLSENI